MPTSTTSPLSDIQNLWLFSVEPERIPAKSLVDVFEKTFLNKTVQVQSVLEAVADDNSLVLAITIHPIVSLALRLEKSTSTEVALAEWIQSVEEILKRQRGNRRKIVFVDIQALADKDVALGRNLLAERVSGGIFSHSLKAKDIIPEAEPINVLCAAALLNSNAEARNLMNELLAATIGANSEIIDTTIIDNARNNLSYTQENELELLRSNLRHHTKELKRLTDSLFRLQAQLADEQRKALDQETELQSEVFKMRRDRDAARREAEKQKKHIKQILTTKSWRVTAPLRKVRGWF